MSREIKFRAWTGTHWLKPMEMAKMWMVGSSEQNLGQMALPEDIELMQYTGLKDKDYKSIYEGDIVRTRDAGDGEVMMHPNGFWAIKLINIQGQPEHHLYSHVNIGCEVVGNVYENPELVTLLEGDRE